MIQTKYGTIATVIEYGQLKCDFNNSKFNNVMALIGFLNDKPLLTKIFKY